MMYQKHSSEIMGDYQSTRRWGAVVVHPLLLLILFLISFPSSVARDTITTTQPLHDNETLISPDGSFALGFFTPSGSNKRYIGLWYNKIRARTVVWVANRRNPVTNSTGVLSLSANGSLLIADQNNDVVWSSNTTTGVSNPVAQLLDTGNLVVREVDGNGDFAWEGFHYPTDTLIAGMKLGVDLVTGLNRTLTAWTSDSDPWPSQYYVTMDARGYPELLLCEGSRTVWRSGPWNGLRFSGIPDTLTYDGFTFSFVNNKQEITYSFVTKKTIVSRLVANHSGLVQRSLWMEAGGFWNYFWYAPRDQCDFLSPCGPYDACNPNSSPMCDCLRGFTPKSPYEWALRDRSDGCVRKTPLDCKNGTDGFQVLQNTKLPDTTASTLDMSLNLDECRAKCLSSCACTAYAPADVRNGGSGCVIWTTELTDLRVYDDAGGQDLYVRLAAADLGPPPSQVRKSKTAAIAALIIILVVGIVLIACLGCLIWRRRKRARAPPLTNSFHNLSNNVVDRSNELELPIFDLAAIAAATDNFSDANKLGEGGFGPVYKGTLGDGREIAVKRLAKTSVQGIDEFKNEVMLIAKLQHRNLVRLLGCCIEQEETALVYEYMPNKSLDVFLFDKSKGTALDWQRRYQIIMGIARGLLYLHHDSRLRIIHRDLKASNILLDNDMNPRISDFGLARIFGGDEAEANTIKVVGTYGYMSPEYAMEGIFSQKSDVFSFGVLVLEIIGGKRNRGAYFGAPHMNLLSYTWSLWSEGNTLQLVDEALGYSYPMNEVMRCIKVGLLCVQDRPEDRPLMSSVVFMLSSDNAPLPFPDKPGFVTRGVVLEMDSSPSSQKLSSAIDITDQPFEGR